MPVPSQRGCRAVLLALALGAAPAVITGPHQGDLAGLRRQAADGAAAWDVIDMSQSDNLAACEEGLIAPIDHAMLAAAPDGTPPAEDFIPGALVPCGVTHSVSATVIAFNREAFAGRRPTSAGDLFDTTAFPGRRALQRAPQGNLEWGLLAYDVPREDVYDLLSTRRGLRLALERVEGAARDAVWWQDPARPAELLAAGRVAMATGDNGRFFAAAAGGTTPGPWPRAPHGAPPPSASSASSLRRVPWPPRRG